MKLKSNLVFMVIAASTLAGSLKADAQYAQPEYGQPQYQQPAQAQYTPQSQYAPQVPAAYGQPQAAMYGQQGQAYGAMPWAYNQESPQTGLTAPVQAQMAAPMGGAMAGSMPGSMSSPMAATASNPSAGQPIGTTQIPAGQYMLTNAQGQSIYLNITQLGQMYVMQSPSASATQQTQGTSKFGKVEGFLQKGLGAYYNYKAGGGLSSIIP